MEQEKIEQLGLIKQMAKLCCDVEKGVLLNDTRLKTIWFLLCDITGTLNQ